MVGKKDGSWHQVSLLGYFAIWKEFCGIPISYETQGLQACGAAIVRPDLLLTAAHCFGKEIPSHRRPDDCRKELHRRTRGDPHLMEERRRQPLPPHIFRDQYRIILGVHDRE